MKNPLIVMSAITGKPSEAEIFEYLKMLKENGIHQAMIYPRSGCELEYLSDEWFDTIEKYIISAQKLNMNIWLYDDFNWPSGDACGKVTKIKDFRLKSITISGEKTGEISYHSTHNASLFGEKFFPDLLNYNAVDYFIECTHEKYYERFSEYFGNVIKGFFTDEPAIGYCCTVDSIPYYNGIENDYTEFCGRDFNDDIKNDIPYFTKTCMCLVSERFNRCFIKKISSWCKDRNIVMTGHLLLDNEPKTATMQNGNFLKNLSDFMLPGIDDIETDFTSDSLFSLLGGAEYAHSDMGAMAELFALGPCDMSFSKKLCMIFLCACFKINHYFLAISHLDMRGNLKITDFFNNFSSDQPDFRGTLILAKEAEKAARYAKKDYTPDVYVRYPTDICLKGVTDQAINTKPFLSLLNTLSWCQIQWKFINDNDQINEIPVIEFTDKFNYILNDTVTDDADEIIKILNIKPRITDKNGDIPKGIFSRFFDDKTFIVINLFAEDGEYLIDGKSVFLDKHQVFISADGDIKSEIKTQETNLDFNINYCNDNIIRTMHINSNKDSAVYCDKDQNIVFAVRKGTEAYLNGEKIVCSDKNNYLLSRGLKAVYSTSDILQLKKGKNIITTANDYKYLPSVLMVGNFEATVESKEVCSVILKDRKKSIKCGEFVSDFGKIEMITSITIPENTTAIELVGTKLYTSVFADDIFLGEKIHSPFIYNIDERFWNKKITLKIVQRSSMAPLFGDVKFFDENSETAQWRGTPNTEKTLFGIEYVNLIFRS